MAKKWSKLNTGTGFNGYETCNPNVTREKQVRERSVEKRLKTKCEKLGIRCLKIQVVAENGWMDRLLVFPFEKVIWVECKRPTTKIKKGGLQEVRRDDIKDRGFEHWEVNTVAKVDLLVYHCKKLIADYYDGDIGF